MKSELTLLDSNCEILWVKIITKDRRSLNVCAYYRPKTTDTASAEQFEQSLRRATSNDSRIIVAGDFNLPDWDWERMALKENAKNTELHTSFVDLLHDLGMEQLVKTGTRENNTLDLVITNTPLLVPRLEVAPGISDHCVVYFEYKSKVVPMNNRKKPFPIFSKANWDEMRKELVTLLKTIRDMKTQNRTTEELWTTYKTTTKAIEKQHVPHSSGGGKSDSFPWITYTIKKKIRARDRLYTKMKKGQDELKAKVKDMNKDIQKQLRRSHWNYVNGLFAKKGDEITNTQRTKHFWTYMKHQRNSQSGVPPLKDKGLLVTDNTEKAEVLSRQFISAYSQGKKYSAEEMLTKCKLEGKKEDFPTMPDFKITTAGVETLLRKLDPAKAPGPDEISPRLLKELAKEKWHQYWLSSTSHHLRHKLCQQIGRPHM